MEVIDGPSCSPDLNPIENLWGDLKRILQNKNIKNLNDLAEQAEQAWHSIPLERCQHLAESMPRRCKTVIESKGYSIKY